MGTENNIRTYIPCDCTCSILEISDWKDENESFISLYVDAYQEKGATISWTIKRRIKAAWHMLRGKEFLLYELCLPKEQLRNTLKEYLTKTE
jgi:hypothetical protein